MSYKSKSYSKFIASAATATMVAAVVAPFASAAGFSDVAPKYNDAVNFLGTKGIEGFSDTKFGTDLNIKRVDAAVMVAKVLGLDVNAAPASGFKDVPSRAVKYVNAIKAAGITSGKTPTQFDADSQITRGELAIWIQKGFDLKGSGELNFKDVNPRYVDAVKALVSNGITNGVSATEFGVDQPAKRGDFAIFLHKASGAEVQSSTVSTVSSINATQVQVTFNTAVDAKSLFIDGVSGAFKAGVLSIRSIDSVTDGTLTGELSKDGKVLTVTSTQLFEKRYDVVIDKVTTSLGEKVEKYSKIISIDKDVKAPSIIGTEAVTATQVKVKFSEPMTNAGSISFKLADGTVVSDITGQGTLVDGGKAVLLDLSDADVPESKDITATIIGAADMAGNLLNPNPAQVTFQKGAKDGVAPTVSSVTQTGATTFEIKFSEAVVVKPTVAIDSQAISASDVVIDSEDATKVTVTAGSVLDGDKVVSISNFADFSGEVGETTNRVVKFVKDTAAPQLVSTSVVADATDKAEYLEFTFDKNVNLSSATVDVTGGNHVKDHVTTPVVDGDISAQTINYKDTANKKVVRVKLDTLLGGIDVEGANYSVDVAFANVTSEAGVAITTGKATFTRGIDGAPVNTDVIALAASNAIVQNVNNNDEIVVTFDKNVDAATATETSNYIVGGAIVDSATVSSTDLTKVTLKLRANSNTFSGVRNVTVQNVKAAGSTVAMTTVTKVVNLNENVAPTVTAQLQSDLTTVKLTFSENVLQTANSTDDFAVLVGTEAYTYDHDTDVATPAIAFKKDSGLATSGAGVNTINITLPSTVTADQLIKGLSLEALNTLDIKDVKGNKLSVSGNITISR
ncbi:S-layer homology domain-containing protein [Ferdinandcohnia quinoae]|uniref:S-layer homology domain-containing protein n=1 Tax=Fredinandcohnia quinoae TaxID=2918902 RepID=A0AAW5DXN0_9BACI|nr:S-layer homology domain-containing protein [Fredinandcohnia sp. SECRCQ15]MCH1625103.1 S-layer homology domain-containing protein [Fredinandcohnia sp. SECRCQ15]